MLLRMVTTRLALALITLLVLSMLIFWTTEVLPGDIAKRVLGREAPEEAIQAFHKRLHLDRPVYERYLLWLQGVLKGDFGQALTSKQRVSDIIAPKLRNTIVIGALAFLIYIPVSLCLATLAALFRDRVIDNVISLVTLLGLSTPEFVVGTILLILFAVKIPLFPVISLIDGGKSPLESLRALILPAGTISIIMSAYAIRMLRDNLIEVLDSEYIRMATLKGLHRHQVILRHAIPNALIPALNVTALNLAYLIGGVIVVERVFSYPGLGSLVVESVLLRDAPVIEAVALIVSVVYVFANLIADVAAILLNPRLRS